MKKNVRQYLVADDNVDIILDRNNLQQIIDGLQEIATQADVPATEIKVRYSECYEGCDEISFYYDRPETDEEYEERIKKEAEEFERRKAYISSQYTKLKNELVELDLLDESGNLVNPEV